MNRPAPELLSPAGSLQHLAYAFAYGADAVYAGQPRYSLRARNNAFTTPALLGEGIARARALGKQFYVVCNIAPHNAKVKTFMADMEPVIALGPDALIMSDPGLIMLVRERWPDMPVHLSVQANVVNYASARFWQAAGVARIILSRELSIEEIAETRALVPDLELEVFVHGALCMAYSGRCLLSGYINHRDANQGTCTNACRWKYQAHEAVETEAGLVPVNPVQTAEPAFLLQETGRPGEYLPAYEDEHGTYIMNSKDLRAVEHVPRLCAMGVHSLKIEGRTKSHYYVARTAQVYRRAIDDAVAGRPFDPGLLQALEGLASRGYTEGFYRRHTHDSYQNYTQGVSVASNQQFVGEVQAVHEAQGLLTIEVKNRFQCGDRLELMTPAGNHRFRLTHIESLLGESRGEAPGAGHVVRIPMPPGCDGRFALLMRDLP